jgi:hypothetical protein
MLVTPQKLLRPIGDFDLEMVDSSCRRKPNRINKVQVCDATEAEESY